MDEDPYVEVNGYGTASATPDQVRIRVAAVARAPAVEDAFAAADTGAKAMLAAAREHGVPDAHLRSTHVDLGAGRRGRGKGPGFRASMGIDITVDDVAAAGTVLAAVVAAGGDMSRVHRVSLAATSTEDALSEARANAWSNALGTAEQYARLSGRELGAVLRVSESPQYRAYAMAAQAEDSGFSPVPIEPGSQAVAVTITARWALR